MSVQASDGVLMERGDVAFLEGLSENTQPQVAGPRVLIQPADQIRVQLHPVNGTIEASFHWVANKESELAGKEKKARRKEKKKQRSAAKPTGEKPEIVEAAPKEKQRPQPQKRPRKPPRLPPKNQIWGQKTKERCWRRGSGKETIRFAESPFRRLGKCQACPSDEKEGHDTRAKIGTDHGKEGGTDVEEEGKHQSS